MAHSTVRDRPLFFDGVEGGGGVGKFWNKLFAEAVITEKNCMQVKKEDGDKKMFAVGAAYKKMFAPSPPRPVKKK